MAGGNKTGNAKTPIKSTIFGFCSLFPCVTSIFSLYARRIHNIYIFLLYRVSKKGGTTANREQIKTGYHQNLRHFLLCFLCWLQYKHNSKQTRQALPLLFLFSCFYHTIKDCFFSPTIKRQLN